MSDQDSEFSRQEDHNSGIDATALNLLAMLHFNSTTTTTLNGGSHQQPTTTTTLNGGSHQQPTTTATPLFSSNNHPCNKHGYYKRQSPSSLSPLQEPSSKRATLFPPSFSTTATNFPGDHSILGFTKLPLPPTLFNASSSSSLSPPLRRTISDPINSRGANNLSEASISMGNFLNNQLPESSEINSAATSPSQPLYRSISDPTSTSYQLVTTATPACPSVARKVVRSPSVGEADLNLKEESPNTKRLKRMKDRLREMSQWWNEVIKEGEEDNGSEDNDSLPKEESELSQVTESEGPCEEAVWVERNGECLILHFKCPCGEGYQILLSGKNCYYKLAAF